MPAVSPDAPHHVVDRSNARRLVLVMLAISAGACHRTGQPSRPVAPTSQATAVGMTQSTPRRATATPTSLPAAEATAAASALAAARQAFAGELGLAAALIEAAAVEPVTWPDSSLGCPKPGEFYLQVLTPGFRIRLVAGDQTATYHTDRGRGGQVHVVRCDETTPLNVFGPLPEQRLDDLTAAALDKARRDLEGRLASGSEVKLAELRVADVGELLCPGTPTPVAGGPGKVVLEFLLRAGDETHLYRCWGDEVLYCGLAGGYARE